MHAYPARQGRDTVTAVFSLQNVMYSYANRTPVLNNVTLDFYHGERTAILGANGTGKSTLLSLLDGLAHPHTGSITAFGKPLTEHMLMDRVFSRDFRKRVAFVFSNPDVQLFSSTVWDEIAFGPLQLDLSPSEVTLIVEQQLESLRIADLRDRAPYTLSDGQKKKVAIASSLATDPEVLLLDEPTSGLDPRTQVWLIELLWELHKKGKTIIAATHDLSIAGDIADRVIVLSEDHTVAADGKLSEIIGNDDLLLMVNLIHEHAHRHGDKAHVHRHGHYGHYHHNGGSENDMHKGHSHSHGHEHEDDRDRTETLRKLQVMIEHWIDHNVSHAENYREWASKASQAGEEEVSREIHLAVEASDEANKHLKRAKAILAAKLVLRK
jgi:cobalt/nickel transport system ATP-binding protein